MIYIYFTNFFLSVHRSFFIQKKDGHEVQFRVIGPSRQLGGIEANVK